MTPPVGSLLGRDTRLEVRESHEISVKTTENEITHAKRNCRRCAGLLVRSASGTLRCRACDRERLEAWRNSHPEQVRATNREHCRKWRAKQKGKGTVR